MFPFDPTENRKPKVLRCFQEGQKEIGKESGNVGYIPHTDLLLPFLILNICIVG